MISRNWVESIVGAAVLVVAVWFLAYSYRAGAGKNVGDGYAVVAKFTNAAGIDSGADVRISGIPVGKVASLALDPGTYLAEVRLLIDPATKIPTDSSIAVKSESLLGGRYLSIEPGADEKMLPAGGEIKFTQPAVSLEDLIGKLIFTNNQEKK
ncbi:MAG: outer membrane lipid asymmetry maintenance protein MlaD [Alphaproteobacteria bacterium]|nr:outer membrane lipid asymmetry maintenance protein MlaD [Alphaproteobacteria bacterium]